MLPLPDSFPMYPVVRRERAAHDIRRDRRAAAFAQPHVERQQGVESEQREQPPMPRLGRAMARDAMADDGGIFGGQWRDRRGADETVEQDRKSTRMNSSH